MLLRSPQKRKGSVLVEYGLLVAGVALTCVLAIAVLGAKTFDVYATMAAIVPGGHAEDNKPIVEPKLIPKNTDGQVITLDATQLVNKGGLDRMQDLLGPGGGDALIVDGQ
ncbi:MAG: hypothetical protein JO112_14090 [Planctomycetes bacterium]|nr:hypothetical protein [Planctomycetota bacterium]